MPSRKPPFRGAGRYLAPGERIAQISRRHPIVLTKPFLAWLVTLLVVAAISFFLTEGSPIPVVDTVTLLLGMLATLYLGFKYLQWWRERYVITDQRVLLIEGIVAVKVSAVSLSRVTETSFSRSLWGRVLGYGDLKLDSAGEQLGLATLRFLPRPDVQYRLITSLLIGSRAAERTGQQQIVSDPSEANTGPLPPVVL